MEFSDTLLTLAELAIALAGFSSLFSVLDRHPDPASRRRARADLQMMLEIGLRNATFAVVPIPLLAAGLAGPPLWRTMSALYLAAMLGHIAYQRRRGDLEILSHRSDLRPFLVALPTVSGIASAANVVGLGGPHAFAFYIASLILGLSFAGLLFLAVARRMVGEEQS
jgi:hypothetical protein